MDFLIFFYHHKDGLALVHCNSNLPVVAQTHKIIWPSAIHRKDKCWLL